MNFESATEIETRRQDLRQARQSHLEKAKEKYEKEERKKERAKARGDDTWMLSSVNQRLETEKQSLKKSKKKKKEKKKKSRRKKDSSDSDSDSDDSTSKKKNKKKKKRKKSSSSSSSDSEDGDMWVEKSGTKKPSNTADVGAAVKGPKLERDSWMNAPPELFPTVSRQDLINKRNKEKEELEKQKEALDKPGAHAKELNPYWKDGGTGVPEERSGAKVVAKVLPGDAGLSWLKKSYERCVQQAKEEGRPLEELAAERWGSLKEIQKQIREAEDAKYGRNRNTDRDRNTDRARNTDRDRGGGASRFMKPRDDDDSDNHRHSNSHNRRPRSRSPERSNHRKRSRTRSNSRGRRSPERSNDRRRSRSRSNSRGRRSRSRDRYRDRRRSRSNDRKGKSSGFGSSSSMKGRFMRPGEMGDDRGHSGSRSGKGQGSDSAPAWRKKEFQKPSGDDDLQGSSSNQRSSDNRSHRDDRDKRDSRRDRRRKSSSSDSSSSSESSSESSSGSDDDRGHNKGQMSSPQQQEVKILSEKEMNDLAAKLVKAEIMGNEEQAVKLKSQLEAAREAKKNAPARPQGQGHGGKQQQDDDDDFVTLTRSGRSGMSRPVPDSNEGFETSFKKRRKKLKVETHEGKQGERTKYFDDDDKFDLKTMVEREKLGTAEDQNQMFARLAGRAAQRTDDDFQVDDIFLSKAHEKQSESIQEQRDRAAAIFEHKKMAASLQKCGFCFGNIPKHLIIAIGTKVYLSLPNHKSLTEGHCLIVPMQHVASSTAVDEDVWSEIQVFRKTLTRMFGERDEDVVFMETSMRLKQFPHMCIECLPMDKEVGDLAPIYFKKAIQESESEWSNNKKVVDLSRKDIRHAVPKGFPYFAVDFGNEGGFAHVIEDEQRFSHYFGKEIIGGMVDADHRLWKKPPKENFEDQRKKVLKFAEMWKPHDWTQNISKNVNHDSSSSDSD